MTIPGSLVRWSPSGKYYAVIVGASGLRVYDVSTAGVVFSLDHRRRINALRFLNGADDDDLLLFGGEGKEMNLASVKEGKITASFDVHETRIRCGNERNDVKMRYMDRMDATYSRFHLQ